MKNLWRHDRHYVATPNMAVWQRLVCLAPDAPDGWSFPDVPGAKKKAVAQPCRPIHYRVTDQGVSNLKKLQLVILNLKLHKRF